MNGLSSKYFFTYPTFPYIVIVYVEIRNYFIFCHLMKHEINHTYKILSLRFKPNKLSLYTKLCYNRTLCYVQMKSLNYSQYKYKY